MKTRGKPSTDARERILDAADRLFYRTGIRASGIDTIIAEAGVAKMTLYAHFKSKDDLIAAYLARRGERTRAWLADHTQQHAAKTGDWLGAFFTTLKEWFESDEFRGCPFINAVAELPETNHPARAAVAEHERLFTAFLAEILKKAQIREPESMAETVAMLVNGAIVSAACGGTAEAADKALRATRALLDRSR